MCQVKSVPRSCQRCGNCGGGESAASAPSEVKAAILAVQSRMTCDIRAIDSVDPASIEDHCGTITMRLRAGSTQPIDAVRADVARVLAPLGYTQFRVLQARASAA